MKQNNWNRKERTLLILGTLKAALLIAGAYLLGIGLLILLLCTVWM